MPCPHALVTQRTWTSLAGEREEGTKLGTEDDERSFAIRPSWRLVGENLTPGPHKEDRGLPSPGPELRLINPARTACSSHPFLGSLNPGGERGATQVELRPSTCHTPLFLDQGLPWGHNSLQVFKSRDLGPLHPPNCPEDFLRAVEAADYWSWARKTHGFRENLMFISPYKASCFGFLWTQKSL